MYEHLRRVAKGIPGLPALVRLLRPHGPSPRVETRSPEEIFTGIFETNYWGSEVSRSGQGSDDVQTREVVRVLPQVLRSLGARSMLDLPCGDFHWMQRVNLGDVAYIGGDIVPQLVDRNQRQFGAANRRFARLDLIADPLPRVDVVLVRDCLVHLSFDLALKALRNIRASGSTWLITTTFTGRDANLDIPTGDWYPINLERHPFSLPMPEQLIVEGCSEADGVFADKSLGVWRIDSIADGAASARDPEVRPRGGQPFG